jgi:hypothetical protein
VPRETVQNVRLTILSVKVACQARGELPRIVCRELGPGARSCPVRSPAFRVRLSRPCDQAGQPGGPGPTSMLLQLRVSHWRLVFRLRCSLFIGELRRVILCRGC